MSARLSPQREFEIGARAGHLYEYSTSHDVEWDALAGEDVPALLAELAATREELAAQKDHVDHLERNTLPDLRREVEHHKAGKERWRKRAVEAEAMVYELKRPAIEKRRAEIRSSYVEAASQAEQDRDYEGAANVAQLLADAEAKWQRDDEEATS